MKRWQHSDPRIKSSRRKGQALIYERPLPRIILYYAYRMTRDAHDGPDPRETYLPPRAFFAPTNKTHALHARVPGAPLLLLAPFLLLQRVGHGSGVSFLSEHHLASHFILERCTCS